MLASFEHFFPTAKPSPRIWSTLRPVSHFTRLVPLSQLQLTLTLPVLPEQMLNHLDLVGLKDYHAPKGDLSLDEYGYASDSDLDDEDEEIDQTVHNSTWHRSNIIGQSFANLLLLKGRNVLSRAIQY
jgi:hypothetical protein